ncbi:hypothetical protein LNTAR_09826 [Lentisphaera araneosa HTCC2155]|jgi:prepilin-type N-terminal cleavage/methylation domain-containing protein|uniref:Uncharacterized protein n=1 Tax=Lentisphaera araneosa HTCC2155 TaxID=313628 RepID=A6DSH8_9BACT|nr:type II secretion system protein [Lentisphaera araneosa]EDM25423.1 hypothetical protein LNTAR_09826 [Lentisphaera araneosa HTCC2155]
MKKYCLKQFTLIELLVVIAIIGILASMLLPVLGKARKTSQAALSINNLKQISISAMIYADDNNSVLPYATGNVHPKGGGGADWPRTIYEHIFGMFSLDNDTAKEEMDNDSKYNGMLYCPVLLGERDAINNRHGGRSAYSMNVYFEKPNNDYNLNALSGKIEPYIMPGTPSNSQSAAHADSKLDNSRFEENDNGFPAYSYNDKALALFIGGHVETMSAGHGGSIDAIVEEDSDFQ